MSLDTVAAQGDRLATLRELRDVLAGAIVRTRDGRDIAALSSRLTDVLDQIAVLEAGAPDAQKGTALDEFSQRRAAQQAKGSASPAKRSQRR